MKIQLVTHCFRYPTLLRYQLSSLQLSPPPPGIQITATVFYSEEDTGTSDTLKWFAQQKAPGVHWDWRNLPVLSLCRRSIGRNIAALSTTADWVWFTDADYWFSTECWQALSSIDPQRLALIYPRIVMTHAEHSMGDRAIETALKSEGLVSTDLSDFFPRPMKRAIGGIQIVSGDTCRERGYLPNHRRAQLPTQQPVFEKNHADVWFRKDLGMPGLAVDLPGVYRIRHSNAGRLVPGLVL